MEAPPPKEATRYAIEKRHGSPVFACATTAALLLIATLPLSAQAVPPTVEIASPAPGATVCGTITVSAAASDTLGVAGVRFESNGTPFGAEDTSVPYRTFAQTNTVADGVYALTAIARNVLGEQSTSAPVTVTVDNAAPYCSPKFIPTFLVYYGGGSALVAGDEQKLAKYDLINIDRFRYDDINSNTWAAIKAFNPNTQIYLYEMGPETTNFNEPPFVEPRTPAFFLNNISRYDDARGHSMGSLNGNHPELFLLDSQDNRIYNAGFSDPANNKFWYLMDFGSPTYQSYWLEAVQADVISQAWVADGIHADNCLAVNTIFSPYSGISVTYPDDSSWSPAMINFTGAITSGLRSQNQKLWCNRGGAMTRVLAGQNAWFDMDNAITPPDVVGDEGAFAVRWGGPQVSTIFYPQAEWAMQVQTLGGIANSRVAVFSHTKLSPTTASGFDNWQKPVTFWQSLWYAMGSFLISKKDAPNNAYFYFDHNSPCGGYCQIQYFDEYDMLDLGKALGGYTVSAINGTDIYWREFERGYVYVNPTVNNVSVPVQPSCTGCRQRTHESLYTPSSQLPVVTSIQLNGHHAAIVLKN